MSNKVWSAIAILLSTPLTGCGPVGGASNPGPSRAPIARLLPLLYAVSTSDSKIRSLPFRRACFSSVSWPNRQARFESRRARS